MPAKSKSAKSATRRELIDTHNVPIQFVDYLVSAGMNGNTVHLNLGTTNGDRLDDPMLVIIAARLRLTPDFARKLHRALGHILKEEPPKRRRTKAIVSGDPPTKAIN